MFWGVSLRNIFFSFFFQSSFYYMELICSTVYNEHFVTMRRGTATTKKTIAFNMGFSGLKLIQSKTLCKYVTEYCIDKMTLNEWIRC